MECSRYTAQASYSIYVLSLGAPWLLGVSATCDDLMQLGAEFIGIHKPAIPWPARSRGLTTPTVIFWYLDTT